MLTTKLNSGHTALAKQRADGTVSALQYLGRPQAEAKAASVGGTVYRSAQGRAFYVLIG